MSTSVDVADRVRRVLHENLAAGAPYDMVAIYVMTEFRHGTLGHAGDAQDCGDCGRARRKFLTVGELSPHMGCMGVHVLSDAASGSVPMEHSCVAMSASDVVLMVAVLLIGGTVGWAASELEWRCWFRRRARRRSGPR